VAVAVAVVAAVAVADRAAAAAAPANRFIQLHSPFLSPGWRMKHVGTYKTRRHH
jgi:hypothetical protein